MNNKSYKNKEWLKQKYEIEELEVWEIAEQGGTTTKMIHEWLQRFNFYSMDEPKFIDLYPETNSKPLCIVCRGESGLECLECC